MVFKDLLRSLNLILVMSIRVFLYYALLRGESYRSIDNCNCSQLGYVGISGCSVLVHCDGCCLSTMCESLSSRFCGAQRQ